MKITSNWLKDHLDTKLTENQIIDKLTDIGLEVESVDSQSSDLKSFEVAKIFDDVGVQRGVSLNMQSMDKETLKNIKRDNIKMEFFKSLLRKYVEAGIATYTEFILPLPGETYESWKKGMNQLLDSSQHSGLLVYNVNVMPNAELGDKNYLKKYKIETVDIPLFQAHSAKSLDEDIVEYEPIVVSTYSMSTLEWKRTYKFTIFLLAFHFLGLLQAMSVIIRHKYGIKYTEFFELLINYGEKNKQSFLYKELNNIEEALNGMINGKNSHAQYVDGFEEISWPPWHHLRHHLNYIKVLD